MNEIQVFSSDWFELHQAKLLWFANTRFGRWLLRIHGNRSSVGDNKITKIMPHFISWEGNTEFRTHEKFAKRLYYGLKPLWFLLHGWDFVFGNVARELDFGFSTLTAYPDADPETTSVDGYLSTGLVTNNSWATIIAHAGADHEDSTSQNVAFTIDSHNSTDGWRLLARSIFLFDTSAIPDTDVISAAVLSLWGVSKADTYTVPIAPDIDIYTSTPASNTALVDADFAQLGSTSQTGAPISYASMVTGAYNDFTFNATGRGNVSKTGVSKFGARNANYDAAAVSPTWESTKSASLSIKYADQAGTTNDPKIVVTHAAAGGSGPAGLKTLNTVASANIKTIDTKNLADVKTWDTVA